MKKIMHKLFLIFVLTCTISGTACSKANDPLIQDTNGATFKLSQMKGKWLIINYWAGWCEACREEVPDLNKFSNKIKNSNVSLYGINYDGLKGVELKKEMQKMGMKYPSLTSDPGWSWGLTDISILPTTFIISPKGQVIKKFVGGTTEKNLEDTLAEVQKTF